jgi:GxxExxY protein
METNEITREIIGAAMRVHSALGPGLLEGSYRACMCLEMELKGIRFQSELELPIVYLGRTIEPGYRVDLLVEDLVIVELKAISVVAPVHESQLLSYLRLSRRNVGLLINFHVQHLRDGIRRMVNNYRGPRIEEQS